MICRSRIAYSIVAAVALAVCALVASPTTASAMSRHFVRYDALGDSYAAGYGVPPYGPCYRSDSAYAVQLDRLRRIDLDDFVACAGATTQSLVTDGQLQALDNNTDLVTISVGGNDIGWTSALGACLRGTDEQCSVALAEAKATTMKVLPGLLDSVYSQVSDRAPHARVVVTGYPWLFSPQFGPVLGASTSEQRALNRAADLLNRVIARITAKHCFTFVDVTERFLGHGVDARAAWILGPLDAAAFHPNAAGYAAYTAAVISAIKPKPSVSTQEAGRTM